VVEIQSQLIKSILTADCESKHKNIYVCVCKYPKRDCNPYKNETVYLGGPTYVLIFPSPWIPSMYFSVMSLLLKAGATFSFLLLKIRVLASKLHAELKYFSSRSSVFYGFFSSNQAKWGFNAVCIWDFAMVVGEKPMAQC
jgi:hypothetical protein